MLREAVFTALRTGLRRANVRDLSWSEVDLPRALIRIPASKAKGKRDITVPIAPDLLDVLRKLRTENEAKATPSTRVFDGLGGLERAFRSACKRAGLRDVTFHDLRRTYLTRLAPHCDPKTLQALGGHGDIATTMRHQTWGRAKSECARRSGGPSRRLSSRGRVTESAELLHLEAAWVIALAQEGLVAMSRNDGRANRLQACNDASVQGVLDHAERVGDYVRPAGEETVNLRISSLPTPRLRILRVKAAIHGLLGVNPLGAAMS